MLDNHHHRYYDRPSSNSLTEYQQKNKRIKNLLYVRNNVFRGRVH